MSSEKVSRRYVSRATKSMSRNRLAAVLFTSASAGLAHEVYAQNTVSNYTGGASIGAPVTGTLSAAMNWDVAPVAGLTTELHFNGSGGTAYVATDDLGTANSPSFVLNSMQLFSTATVGETIAAANSSINSLTFDGTAPSLLQNGTGDFTINTNILLNQALTIGGAGTGKLTFGGTINPISAVNSSPNTTPGLNSITVSYTGAPVTFTGTVNTGGIIPSTIGVGGPGGDGIAAVLNIASGAVVQTAGTLNLDVNGNDGSANDDVIGQGTLRLVSTTNNGTTSPDIYFGPDHAANSYYGARLSVATLDLGSSQRYIFANSGHNSVSNYNGNEDARISSSIVGSGGITYVAQDNYSGLYPPLSLAGSNTFTGKLEIDSGSVYLQNAHALVMGNQLVFNTSNQARLFLYGNNATVSNLQSFGSGSSLISNGNVQNHDPIGAATLTVNQTTNTTFAGALVDAQAEYDRTSGYATKPLSLTLSNTSTGTLTLTGSSSYSGATTVNGGTLALGPNAVLGVSAITVASGAHFAAHPGTFTATSGGTLTFSPGSTFDMNDGAVGTFNVSGSSTGASVTLPGINLGFDLGVSATDTLNIANTASISGVNTINLTQLSTAVQNGAYNLITAASGLTGSFQFSNGMQTMNTSSGVTLALSNSDTAETLTVSGAVTAFWKGNLSGVWNAGSGTATNWTTDAAGTIGSAIPGAATNVVFTTTGGTPNLNTTLGQDFTVGSLNFTADTGGSITIGGSNTLTILGGGITVASGSQSHTISSAVALGADQTWTNSSANPFNVSGSISGSQALTFAGVGTFVLSGSNSYGATVINSGTNLQVGNGGTTGTLGTGSVTNLGTLTLNRSDATATATPVVTGAISGTGNIVVNGTGTALITGAITTTGTTTVDSGTLEVSAMTVPNYAGAVTIASGATLANIGTLKLAGSTTANVATIGGAGTLALMSTTSSPSTPDILSLVTSSNYYALEINVPIYLGPGLHYIGGTSGNNSFGRYGTGDLLLENNLSGSGGLAVSGAPYNSQFEVALQGDNSNWTGPLVINRGDIAVVDSVTNALSANNTVTFNPTAGNTAALYLFSTNITIGSLSGTTAGNMYIRNGSVLNSPYYYPADATLTVVQTTPGTFGGVISDGPDDYYAGTSVGTSFNRLGLTLAGTAPLTLTNHSTYTGATTINSSSLILSPTAALGNTAITVNAGATLVALPGSVMGDPTVAGAGATLTLNGGVLDTTNGGANASIGIVAIHQNATFGGTALTLSGATLDFNVNNSGVSSVVVDGPASVSGTNLINLTPLDSLTYAPATYALITASAGLSGGTFQFSGGVTTETLSGNSYKLVNTDGAEELAVNGGATVPLNAYWTGSISTNFLDGGNNTATNFATDGTGSTNTNYLPGATTNVFLTASGAASAAATLNQALTINGLTFTSSNSQAFNLSGSGVLTLGAGGITVAPNSQAGIIAVGGLVASVDQTWTDNSTNAPLYISSNISGGNITFAGAGTFVLTGSNTYGNTNISSGATVQLGNGATSGTLGTGSIIDKGTLSFNQSGSVTFARNVSGSGVIAQNGPGALNLNSSNLQLTGGLTVNAGSMAVTGNVTSPLAVTVNHGTFTANNNFIFNQSNSATISGIFQSSGTLNLSVKQASSSASTDVQGSGTLQLISTTDSLTSPDIFFGPDHSGTSYYGARITVSTLDLGSSQRYIVSNSGHNTVAKYYSGTPNVDAFISSSIIGTGGITYKGNQEGSSGFYAPLVLAGSNTFSGPLDIEQGSIYAGLGNNAAVNGNVLSLNNSNAGYSHFFLLGNALTVSNLTSGGTGNTASRIGIANGNPTMNFTVPAAILTVNETTPTSFAGTIADTITDNYDGGSSVPASLSFIKTGPATLTLDGAESYSGPTNVSQGNLIFAPTGTGILSQNLSGGISVANGSSVSVATAANHSNRALMIFGGVSLAGTTGAWTSKIDLSNNDMIVQNGSLSTLTDQVRQGYNAGSWNGTGGITSVAAAADTTHLTALGVIQNSVDQTPTGTQLYSANGSTGAFAKFDGATPADSDVLLKYTYYGDANLTGTVDSTDYALIDYGFLNKLTGWYNGDFNYDGVVNGSDYTLIDNAFNMQGASLASQIASPTAQIAGGTSSAVPEPTSLGLLTVGIAGLLGRRRPRVRRK